MQSLLLDRTTWDLCLDASGNLAVCTQPYAVLQDVSTAIRLFITECWYSTDLGLPYFNRILGANQSAGFFKAQAEAAAEAVPGVASATCVLTGLTSSRQLTGQVQVNMTDGTTAAVSF